MMNKREWEQRAQMYRALSDAGISLEDRDSLRRISVRLHGWYEKECGDGSGCIERDETNDKPYWLNAHSGKRFLIRDDEKGALKRLAAIMAKYPLLKSYIQGDPRGAALYIIRPGDVPDGGAVNSYYSRGICVW